MKNPKETQENYFAVETDVSTPNKEQWHRHEKRYATIEEAGKHWNLNAKTVRVVAVQERILEQIVEDDALC